MLDTKSYLDARTKLIAEDRSMRHDLTLLQEASEDERRAEELVTNIKAVEDKSIWSVDHEGVTNTFAGMEFLSGPCQTDLNPLSKFERSLAKQLVVKTKIFQIISKVSTRTGIGVLGLIEEDAERRTLACTPRSNGRQCIFA